MQTQTKIHFDSIVNTLKVNHEIFVALTSFIDKENLWWEEPSFDYTYLNDKKTFQWRWYHNRKLLTIYINYCICKYEAREDGRVTTKEFSPDNIESIWKWLCTEQSC